MNFRQPIRVKIPICSFSDLLYVVEYVDNLWTVLFALTSIYRFHTQNLPTKILFFSFQEVQERFMVIGVNMQFPFLKIGADMMQSNQPK